MGLPSYVINFDELSDLIKDYLNNKVNVDIGDITFSTSEIEALLKEIKNKIQSVNYNDLINALNALGVKLDGLSGNLGISGLQRIYGKMLEVPSSIGQHKLTFDVPRNGRLTGITYSLSAWNSVDSWDLVVEEVSLFDKVRTKEYGEYKHFNVFHPVKSGNKVEFILNNISGSSKVLWVDFNILEDV